MKPVTDPSILAALEAQSPIERVPVSDPELLRQLEEVSAPRRAPVTDPALLKELDAPKAAPRRQAELRSFDPTWRQQIAQTIIPDSPGFLQDKMRELSSVVLGTTGLDDPGLNVIDFTPARIPLLAQEAGRSVEEGNYGMAALQGIGALPIPLLNKGIEAIASAAPKAVSAAARAAEDLGIAIPRTATKGGVTDVMSTVAKEIPTPIGQNPIRKAAGRALDDIGAKGEEIASKAGTGKYNPKDASERALADWLINRNGDKAVEAAGRVQPPAIAGSPEETVQRSLLESRKLSLSHAVGMSPADLTPVKASERFLQMARSNNPNDINGLVRSRNLLGQDGWSDVSSGLLHSMGLGTDAVAFGKAYGELTENGRNLLFTGELKKSLDALAEVSKVVPKLEGQSQSALGIVGDVMTSPAAQATSLLLNPAHAAMALLGQLPGVAVGKFLSRPETARPFVRWVQAAAKADAKAPAAVRTGLKLATVNLAHTLALETGGDEKDIVQMLEDTLEGK